MITMLLLALSVNIQAQAILGFTTSSTTLGPETELDQGGYVGSRLYPSISLHEFYTSAGPISDGARIIRISGVSSNNGSAYRASFDCSHSYGTITNTICSTPLLSHLDYRLALSFARLDSKLDDYQNRIIHHAETRFLNLRQACGDTACLEDIYTQRLKELGRIRPD